MISKALVALALLGCILLVTLPSIYYLELPDRIPTHYGFNGTPDNYGGKAMIWILTAVGAATYIGLRILGMNVKKIRYQHGELSEKQLAFYHQYTRHTLDIVNLVTVGSFCYINYATIQVALGNQQGLGRWFLPSLLVFVSGLVLYTLINARKLKDLD